MAAESKGNYDYLKYISDRNKGVLPKVEPGLTLYHSVTLEEFIKSGIQFERITTNIAYRKARDWFSEIYWNPHYVWGKKFLENRIDKDEIFIEN